MLGADKMTQYQTQYKNDKTVHGDKDEWRTPGYLYDTLDSVFHFTVDAAANTQNTKCARFWSIQENGLAQSWRDEIVFCNPPHTNGAYGNWVEKATDAFVSGNVTSALVLPFNAETKAFSDVWEHAKYLLIPYKRIKYLLPDGTLGGGPTFHSCVAIFTLGWFTSRQAAKLIKVGNLLNLERGLINRTILTRRDIFTEF